ncbi:hypothetical protein NA57DRAFT_79769 [Rhizodiscina lignyota]|uniref:Uncharacterized protein n=1 Tax=Rhizodiscina lignyota TaxID=1504668 RepID=A0A9P4I9N8_9PEZI|nr:hypothetical protein NA57DRAFT_79769 [Rhizodiscina lignyota]
MSTPLEEFLDYNFPSDRAIDIWFQLAEFGDTSEVKLREYIDGEQQTEVVNVPVYFNQSTPYKHVTMKQSLLILEIPDVLETDGLVYNIYAQMYENGTGYITPVVRHEGPIVASQEPITRATALELVEAWEKLSNAVIARIEYINCLRDIAVRYVVRRGHGTHSPLGSAAQKFDEMEQPVRLPCVTHTCIQWLLLTADATYYDNVSSASSYVASDGSDSSDVDTEATEA